MCLEWLLWWQSRLWEVDIWNTFSFLLDSIALGILEVSQNTLWESLSKLVCFKSDSGRLVGLTCMPNVMPSSSRSSNNKIKVAICFLVYSACFWSLKMEAVCTYVSELILGYITSHPRRFRARQGNLTFLNCHWSQNSQVSPPDPLVLSVIIAMRTSDLPLVLF